MPLTIHTDLDDPAAEKVLSARGTQLFAASVNAQPDATRQISAEAAEIIEAGKKGAKERAAGRLAAKQATPRTIQALINARVAEAAEIRKRSPSTSPAAPSGKNLSTVNEDSAGASNRFNSTYQLPSGQKVMVRGSWEQGAAPLPINSLLRLSFLASVQLHGKESPSHAQGCRGSG